MKNLEKNWLEWIVFAASLVLVVSTLGYLVTIVPPQKMRRPAFSFSWVNCSRN
jgi:hypothetical protein